MELIVIPVVCMVAAVVTHLLACRLRASHAKSLAASFAIGLVSTIIAVGVALGRRDDALRSTVELISVPSVLYLSWWFLFLNCVQPLRSSLRVRILSDIAKAGGQIDEQTLRRTYNDLTLVQLRLRRLRDARAVIEHDGRLFVNSLLLTEIARFARSVKGLVIGRQSEFSV